jgi:DNA-binding beta-propeller fold protein YncE
MVRIVFAAMLITLPFYAPAARSAANTSYEPLFEHVADIPIGDGTDRIDYQSLDPIAKRLYVAKMGAGKLIVFDLAKKSLVATLDNFPKATGVLAVPSLHKVYVSVPGAGLSASVSQVLGMAGLSSGRGAVAILDDRDLHEIARLPGGVFPDGIAYDPADQRIFVSDERGGALIVIVAAANQVIARIDAGGETGNVQYDGVSGKIYTPVQSKDELIVIDPRDLKVISRYRLIGAEHPHGLAIAPGGRVGYVACDGNDRLLTVELGSGKVLSDLPVAHDPDVLIIDPEAKRLYVASESGGLSAFDLSDVKAPRSLGDVTAGPNAHSVAVDPTTHQLYLPLAYFEGRAVMRILAPK